MNLATMVIVGLITWRIASLLKDEPGPFGILSKFRDVVGLRYDEHSELVAHNEFAAMLSCVWCSSLWIGVGISLFLYAWPIAILNGLGASAIAIITNKVIHD